MARYEGMDDILEKLREHLDGELEPDQSVDLALPFDEVPPERRQMETVEQLLQLLQGAHELRQRFEIEAVQGLKPADREEAVILLGKILHELWRCEAALQGVAPYE